MVRYHQSKLAIMQIKGIADNPNQRAEQPPLSTTVDLREGAQRSQTVQIEVVLPKKEQKKRAPVNYEPR